MGFQSMLGLALTGLGIQVLHKAARVRPNALPFELVNSTCNTYKSSLSAREARICARIAPETPILLDFVAPVCGYTIDCSSDPIPIPDHCPIAVEHGVLSRELMPLTLSNVVIGDVWQPLNSTLYCLRDNPEISKHILSLEIEFHRAWEEWRFNEPSDFTFHHPPASPETISSISKVFLEAIHTMNNLTRITVTIPPIAPYIEAFEAGLSLATPATTQSQVQTVTLGPQAHPLIRHFPNIRSASMSTWIWLGSEHEQASYSFLDAISNLTNLEHVKVYRHMNNREFEYLVQRVPHIKNLTLTPDLDLKTSLPFFRNLTQLQDLTLPSVSHLHVGFHPPWCGNMYMDDPTLADRVEAQGARFKTKVTELVCKGVPGLKTVSYEHGNLVNLNNEECTTWRKGCEDLLCLEEEPFHYVFNGLD